MFTKEEAYSQIAALVEGFREQLPSRLIPRLLFARRKDQYN